MNLTTFDFKGSAVRTEIIDGKPMFIAADVAAVLGFKNSRDAIIRHCKGVVKSDTLKAGGHPMSAVPESDVYRLVMRSTLPAAEDFQDWVCDTVLPSIRGNGGYIANQENESPEMIMARALQVANNVIEKHMAEISEAEKDDVLDFWSDMPFDLEIPEWLGNCVFCYKKSNLKLAAAAHDEPEILMDWAMMINEARDRPEQERDGKHVMYRGKRTLGQVVAMFDGSTGDEIKARIRGGKMTDSGSCSESCEVFNCQIDLF